MSEHTPGPWIVNGQTPQGYRIDAPLAGREGMAFLNNPVAIVPNKADAQLVRAAPALLEACEAAADALDRLMGDTDLPDDDSPEFRAMTLLHAALVEWRSR